MTVTPAMSSSSSTATAVSTGSPENTWVGHRARIRLRMVSRRTAGVKVEENRLDSEDKDIRTLGHIPPQAVHLRKGHNISKMPQLTKYTLPPIPSISEYDQRETPLVTEQEGTSTDNLARFLCGGGAGREPQTLQDV